MRINARKIMAGVVGAILVATATIGVTSSLGTFEAATGEHITLGQWQAERASQLEEDQQGWDCRVMGNTQCGSTWYELVCPDAPQTPDLVCTLEPHNAAVEPLK